jgi:hypothetical protein
MKTTVNGNRKATVSMDSKFGYVVEFYVDGKFYQKTIVQILSEAEDLMTEFLNDSSSSPQFLTE